MKAGSKTPNARAGGTVLSLIGKPLTVPVLRAHLDKPLRLSDLHERIDGVALTTLRGQVGNLRGIEGLKRSVRGGMPYTVENELTETGEGVLEVAETVEIWLSRAPQGGIPLGSRNAKEAIKAIVAGWTSKMLKALAARPLSLTELSNVIDDFSYPALERRMSAMRANCQLESRPEVAVGASKSYGVTDWTRQAVGSLVAAGRCECRHLPGRTEPLTRPDIEAAFLLAVPLVELDGAPTGASLLAIDTDTDANPPAGRIAGVHVEIESGGVASCVSRFERPPANWVLGTVEAWVDAIVDGNLTRLRIGGQQPRLSRALVSGMHRSLLCK